MNTSEEWSLHQCAGKDGEKAKELLSKVCDAPDLTASEIREAVRTLHRDYALLCGDKEAAKRWGWTEPAPVAPATPANTSATSPATPASASRDSRHGRPDADRCSRYPPADATQTAPVADASATPPATPATPATCNQGQSILVTLADMAKKGLPKDIGFMLAKTIAHAEDPLAVLFETIGAVADTIDADKNSEVGVDDILETCMKVLKDHKGLSSKGKRACNAFLLVNARKDASPSPAEIAQTSAPETARQRPACERRPARPLCPGNPSLATPGTSPGVVRLTCPQPESIPCNPLPLLRSPLLCPALLPPWRSCRAVSPCRAAPCVHCG